MHAQILNISETYENVKKKLMEQCQKNIALKRFVQDRYVSLLVVPTSSHVIS